METRANTFRALQVVLVAAVVIALVSAPVLLHKGVRVETRTVAAKPPGDAQGLVALLGDPQQTVAGKDLNPNLDGTDCGVYPFADGVALVCR